MTFKNAISLSQFVVLSLLCLSVYLQSPLIALGAVVALAIKEAKEFYGSRQRSIEVADLERKLEQVEQKFKALQNDLNRVVVRQAQYLGE